MSGRQHLRRRKDTRSGAILRGPPRAAGTLIFGLPTSNWAKFGAQFRADSTKERFCFLFVSKKFLRGRSWANVGRKCVVRCGESEDRALGGPRRPPRKVWSPIVYLFATGFVVRRAAEEAAPSWGGSRRPRRPLWTAPLDDPFVMISRLPDSGKSPRPAHLPNVAGLGSARRRVGDRLGSGARARVGRPFSAVASPLPSPCRTHLSAPARPAERTTYMEGYLRYSPTVGQRREDRARMRMCMDDF